MIIILIMRNLKTLLVLLKDVWGLLDECNVLGLGFKFIKHLGLHGFQVFCHLRHLFIKVPMVA